jgi:hypothetical protein
LTTRDSGAAIRGASCKRSYSTRPLVVEQGAQLAICRAEVALGLDDE